VLDRHVDDVVGGIGDEAAVGGDRIDDEGDEVGADGERGEALRAALEQAPALRGRGQGYSAFSLR
jgi:hypothetical protein